MQRVNFIIILLFFLLASCGKQKPKGVLSEKDMTELMAEVSLIDAYLNTLPIDSGRKVMPVFYENAFKKFKLDSAGFIKNLDYYLGSPVLTEKIYTSIGKTLTAKDMEYHRIDSVQNAVVQDSIRNAMRLQRHTEMMKNMILNVHRDSTAYTYSQYGTDFLSKAELNLNAYGIQVPAIAPTVPTTPQRLDSPQEQIPVEERLETVAPAAMSDTSNVKKVLRKSTN
ncbi:MULTISPECIES: DUF4296 domain-containing protein [Sphingobacterium]|uniref:DUF4296 domain-containing protein n=1 Tax=Sphingobacterium TaxID=28453 RepID=UPI0013DA4295|nr:MULTISPECIES: DUF4296 domain-containing protein [unclassified Sphingobacterium]